MTQQWICDRCDAVHDFEEGEEPLAHFYCTIPTPNGRPFKTVCGGTVRPTADGRGEHGD